MADGELQRLGRDPGGPDEQRRAAHAECRAVGHDWDDVALHGGAGFYALVPDAKQKGFLVQLTGKLLSWQRPRCCWTCGKREQRWGPWRPRCEIASAHEFAPFNSELVPGLGRWTTMSPRMVCCRWCGEFAAGARGSGTAGPIFPSQRRSYPLIREAFRLASRSRAEPPPQS